MDLEEIRKLCALMREEDLVELTVEEGGRRTWAGRPKSCGFPEGRRWWP
jgi:hypothetical protein